MRSRRRSLTSLFTAEEFLAELCASGVLPAEATDTLAAEPRGEARAWAAELVERGLLTGYQAEQVLAGKGRALVLGKYRVLDRLGAGGMGRVYKAEHVLMKRVVALKVIAEPDGPLGRLPEESFDSFHGEIQAAARLCHPNIVTAYDAAVADGVPFLVMEYVDGIDLEQLVRASGPLPVVTACDYVRQAAVALQYAYERGVLHRDVKPANLLVAAASPGEPGLLKVLDLGLACLTAPGDMASQGADTLAGTPDYLAPEVARDVRGRDVRSDLYSLGCTFYFLLTGRTPFPGGTWTEKLLRHQLEVPTPLRDLAPGVPGDVVGLVERLLAKTPEDRPATPADLADALDVVLARLRRDPVPPRRGSWRPSGRSAAVAILVGVLAALVARNPAPFRVVGSEPSRAAAPAAHFVVADTEFASLAEAAEAARDGDTVTIDADGPLAIEPLAPRGKALTLRAAPGTRPILYAARATAWQPLLESDRSLTLEGLELRDDGSSGAGPAHLVYVEGAPLSLRDCRLTTTRAAAVVCRDSPRAELRGCRLNGPAPALCVEAGATDGEVVLTHCSVEARGAGAAAVAAWRSEGAPPAPLRLTLEDCDVRAARVLALRDLADGVEVEARGNRFAFTEALLSVSKGGVRWRGAGNHYAGAGDWLRVDGSPGNVRGLRAWEARWGNEPGSGEADER